jgi:23S rRNA pseudouridine1911/1915/1917 synthase
MTGDRERMERMVGHEWMAGREPADGDEREELEDREPAEPASWVVPADEAGSRIDRFLAERLEGSASRSQIQQWIKDGHVTVNGEAVKANYRLAENDLIAAELPEPEPLDVKPEAIELDVVYEDSDVIVVNKPRGMVVHPAPGHTSGTLVNALLHHCRDLSGINGVKRPGIVHRIDKDTSGLLMAAKNDQAHLSLAEQLQVHSVTRKYIAVVHGSVAHQRGTVDAPIGRDPKDRKMFAVTDKNGKPAVTHFTVLERFGQFTVLELALETGRTHQIRVHMKFIGHPLVGDPMYGPARDRTRWITGQALHAGVLGFRHPRTGKQMLFEAPLPEDMRSLIETLRQL